MFLIILGIVVSSSGILLALVSLAISFFAVRPRLKRLEAAQPSPVVLLESTGNLSRAMMGAVIAAAGLLFALIGSGLMVIGAGV